MRREALKKMTSLEIKRQVDKNNFQRLKSLQAVEQATIEKAFQFLKASDFALCLRLVESEGFGKQDLLSTATFHASEVLWVQSPQISDVLAQEFNITCPELAEFLMSGSVFILKSPSSNDLTSLIRALISIEEDPKRNAMLSLCFGREFGSIFDLRLPTPDAVLTRSFYKTYDSKESILLELLNLNLTFLEDLPASLEAEFSLFFDHVDVDLMDIIPEINFFGTSDDL